MKFSKEDWAKALMTDGVKEVVETNPVEEEWNEDSPIVSDDFKEPIEDPQVAVTQEPTKESKAEVKSEPQVKKTPVAELVPTEPTDTTAAKTDVPASAENRTAEKSVETVAEETAEETAAKTLREEKNAKSMSLFEWMEAAIFALIAIAVVFTFVMRTVGVDGDSMNYTLMNGEKLLLSSWWYEPEHGDIVVVRRQNEEPLIKRVIACEGDRLDIDEKTGMVILNGKPLNEPYLDCTTPRGEFTGEVIVPEGHVFVMGDNRGNSLDSRHPLVGFVSVEDIMGKAMWRIAPLDKFGPIYENE